MKLGLEKIGKLSENNELIDKFVLQRFLKKFPVEATEKETSDWINKILIILSSFDIEDINHIHGISIKNKKSLPEAVTILIEELGADVNAVDDAGITALMWSAIKNRYEVAKILVDHGANVEIKEPGDNNYYQEDGGGLLENPDPGEDPPDGMGNNALIFAADYNHIEIAKMLLEAGANVNATDVDGWTSLIKASIKGHEEMVELLLNNKADRYILDKNGDGALVWAMTNDNDKIAEMLIGN